MSSYILVYSTNISDHRLHVKKVLKRILANNLVLKSEKCIFHAKEVTFLGFLISDTGIKMEKENTQAILRLEPPNSVKQVRSFLGMINFYRKFISKFSEIATPLTRLTKKDVDFRWTEDCQKAFDILKEKIKQEESNARV